MRALSINMAHGFTELDKAVIHVISLINFLWLWFSFCLPADGEGWEAYESFLVTLAILVVCCFC